MVDQVGSHYVLMPEGNRSGGLGTVRRGLDIRDGSYVAIKFVNGPNDEITRKVFDREVGALKRLEHPNIVRFRDAGIDETDTYYIVLDWVDKNLDDLFAQPIWSNWDSLYSTIGKPLMDGLAYAHLKGLEHRDIKPKNILVDGSGQPLLADFGIAKLREDNTENTLTVANYRSGPYAPPEFDAPARYVRDVFSIGVVLIQCLSKETIKDYNDLEDQLQVINVPPDVRKLLESCVSRDHLERPRNGSELATAFGEIAQKRLRQLESPSNPIHLTLTATAIEKIAGNRAARADAENKILADLQGPVFAHYGRDKNTGDRDRNIVHLYGSERKYVLAAERNDGGFTVIAVPNAEVEELDKSRDHSLELPPIFDWKVGQPVVAGRAVDAKNKFRELIDTFYEQKEYSDENVQEDGDVAFSKWLRILDARGELSRGEQEPISYKSVKTDGRRSVFILDSPTETDLIGTDWEAADRKTDRRYGHGEVIDQTSESVTLLSHRTLNVPSREGRLSPYDKPSAIAIERQRAAVNAIQNKTVPAPNLKGVLVDPSINAQPNEVELDDWVSNLDATKEKAVRLALGTPEMLVIQGPPGTGKTRFITETVIQTLRFNPSARILIASQTHVAVDNVIERLQLQGLTGIVRLAGDESTVQPGVRNLLLNRQVQKWTESLRKHADNQLDFQAEQNGVEPNLLRAALDLSELSELGTELTYLESSAERAHKNYNSDLATALEEVGIDDLQDRIDSLNERRDELVARAQHFLSGSLTLPANIDDTDARFAIEAIVGDGPNSKTLLERLHLQAQWLERISAEDSLASVFLPGVSVVAGTCTGFLRERAVADLEFDLCIIDEASKATLTEALIPMARSKRWILVGDTRQLPPTDEELVRSGDILNKHELSPEDIKETLFQRLVDHLPQHSIVTLTEQYRMIRPIGDLVSDCFYEGILASPNRNGLPGYEAVMGRPVVWIDTSALDNRHEVGEVSYANPTEVDLAIKQLYRIDRAITMGLITIEASRKLSVLLMAPYRSQVDLLRRKLEQNSHRNPFEHLIVDVLSVDAAQGRESDIALLTLTRSNKRGILGFLGPDYWRRINVALSRARYGMVIIGDAEFIRSTSGPLRTVIKYIEDHPDDCLIRGGDVE